MSANKKNERSKLQAELQLKQEAFVKKERVYQLKIQEQEAALSNIHKDRTEWMDGDESITNLRKMHAEIQTKVSMVQYRTASLVQQQEQELLLAFRQRLTDVQVELEAEKATTDDGATGWFEKGKSLEGKVDSEKERADKEDRLFQVLSAENNELVISENLQNDDKEYLIKELVAVKRGNAELRAKVAGLKVERQGLKGRPSSGGGGGGKEAPRVAQSPEEEEAEDEERKHNPLNNSSSNGHKRVEAESRYSEVLKRLTKLLASERKGLGEVLTSLEVHRTSLNPLESSLRTCVDAVAAEKEHPREHQKRSPEVTDTGAREREEKAGKAQGGGVLFPDIFGGSSGGGQGLGISSGFVADEDRSDAASFISVDASDVGGVSLSSGRGGAGMLPMTTTGMVPDGGGGGGGGGGLVPSAQSVVVEGLSAFERERVVEAWLGMEGTLQALVHRPPSPPRASSDPTSVPPTSLPPIL